MKVLVQDLATVRGGRTIFSGLSFEVAAGQALLLLGPNGCGKTTLIRTIAGFLHPASGRVVLEGGDPEHDLPQHCHYVGHLNAIKASLTVRENAGFWARFLEGAPDRVEGALDRFGLAALLEIPAGYLSAGQKRRLGLSRLLLADRPIWLLDEPTVSLDKAGQATVAEVVGEHVRGGGLCLAATHLPLGFEQPFELQLGRRGPL
jgi:heme exporter protein A